MIQKRFTKRYLKAMHFYVYECMERMNLLGWEVRITDEPPENDRSNAAIWITDNYRTATLYFGVTWKDATPQDQRLSIAHELVHLILHWIWLNHDDDLSNQLGMNAWRNFHTRWIQHAECATEELARIIAPTLPLPPELAA